MQLTGCGTCFPLPELKTPDRKAISRAGGRGKRQISYVETAPFRVHYAGGFFVRQVT